MDNRPSCLYNADVSESVGKLAGPTFNNEWLVMDEVVPEGTQFRAYFRYATAQDFENARA